MSYTYTELVTNGDFATDSDWTKVQVGQLVVVKQLQVKAGTSSIFLFHI